MNYPERRVTMKNGLLANSIAFIDSRKWILCLFYSSVLFQDYPETAFLFETPRIQVNLSLHIFSISFTTTKGRLCRYWWKVIVRTFSGTHEVNGSSGTGGRAEWLRENPLCEAQRIIAKTCCWVYNNNNNNNNKIPLQNIQYLSEFVPHKISI